MTQTQDHEGMPYREVLGNIHEHLRPRNYFEIGTQTGATLRLARCPAISIDPDYTRLHESVEPLMVSRPFTAFYNMTSDTYFAEHDPEELFGAPIDFAFLDGMHLSEFLLRDFINTERHCHRRSIIALHDCLPLEESMTWRTPDRRAPVEQIRRESWWTGDVWRTALLLKRRRPDLKMVCVTAPPTGLVLITNLNRYDSRLDDDYHECVSEMMSMEMSDFGADGLRQALCARDTSCMASMEGISTLFSLR